jgi:hypothetical protein
MTSTRRGLGLDGTASVLGEGHPEDSGKQGPEKRTWTLAVGVVGVIDPGLVVLSLLSEYVDHLLGHCAQHDVYSQRPWSRWNCLGPWGGTPRRLRKARPREVVRNWGLRER